MGLLELVGEIEKRNRIQPCPTCGVQHIEEDEEKLRLCKALGILAEAHEKMSAGAWVGDECADEVADRALAAAEAALRGEGE